MNNLKTYEKFYKEFYITEKYYDDLTPYEYDSMSHMFKNPVNIGWLDTKKNYEKGDVPDNFTEHIEKSSNILGQHRGYHMCPFCNNDRGSSVHYINGNGKTYIFPSLIKHYINKHNYKPPDEFIDVVMSKIKNSDQEYFDMKKYTEYVNKRRTKSIEERTDYRNVTGYGSMGLSGDQNTGPTFNKGPYSATYRQPAVIGVEEIGMEDSYFGEKSGKSKRIRKNKKIEKLRKKRSKYFNELDKKTIKKRILK